MKARIKRFLLKVWLALHKRSAIDWVNEKFETARMLDEAEMAA